jgi:hypothetical protein
VLFFAPCVHELLNRAGRDRGKRRLPADDPGEVPHVDASHLPGDRLLRPGGELRLVDFEQLGEPDASSDLDRLFELPVGDEEEPQVGTGGNGEPAALDEAEILLQPG